jgi:hypothetical protein
MRATRGLWAAVGAGTSLAAAGVLALFVLSVALAVHGWPQVGGSGDPRAVELREAALHPAASAVGTAASPGGSQVVLPGRVTPTPRAPARRRAASGGRVPSRAPRRPGAAGAAPQAPAAAASPAPAPAGPLAQLPQAAGQLVQQATGAAGGVVRPVSPAAAGTVTQAGNQAGGAVDASGQSRGDLVGGLAGGR